MASGTYLLTGPDGPYARERFRCGAGPAGWRYVATREHPDAAAPLGGLDVVLDGRGAAVRVQVTAGGWTVRGGVVGREVLWRRGAQEHVEAGAGFTGTSPVWAVAAGRLAGPEPVRLRLVRLGDEALAARTVEQSWVRTSVSADPARADLERLELDTGERGAVRLVGDVVVAAPGVQLEELRA